MSIKHFVLDWTPPAVLRGIRYCMCFVRPAAYEFVGYAWPANTTAGWEVSGVSQAREKGWNEFLQSMEGTKLFGIRESDLSFPYHVNTNVQNLYLTFGYCLALSFCGKQTATVLDWGGGTGNYHVIAKKLFPMASLDYSSADLPSVCESGRKLLPGIRFIDDDSWKKGKYDFVFSSSSLQYLNDWRPILLALIQSSKKFLYITRMPFVQVSKSFVMIQRAQEYGTEYPGWVINKREFIGFVEKHGLKLRQEFFNHAGPFIYKAPEQNVYMGFLFERV